MISGSDNEHSFDSKDFIEIPVHRGKLNKNDFKESVDQLIDITLSDLVDLKPDTLPYQNEIANLASGKRMGELREQKVRVVLRAEQRTYQQIQQDGGIHPHPVHSGEYANAILDVKEHRIASDGTGYVSTTISLAQVKSFLPQYVYFIKAIGPLPPHASQDEEASADIFREYEYSLPGGIDPDHILGGRKVLSKDEVEVKGKKYTPFGGSSIFLRSRFIRSYPKQALDLVKAILEPHEACILPREMSDVLAKAKVVPSGERVTVCGGKAPKLKQTDSSIEVPAYDLVISGLGPSAMSLAWKAAFNNHRILLISNLPENKETGTGTFVRNQRVILDFETRKFFVKQWMLEQKDAPSALEALLSLFEEAKEKTTRIRGLYRLVETNYNLNSRKASELASQSKDYQFIIELIFNYTISIKSIEQFIFNRIKHHPRIDFLFSSTIDEIDMKAALVQVKTSPENKPSISMKSFTHLIGADGARHHAADVLNKKDQMIEYKSVTHPKSHYHVSGYFLVKTKKDGPLAIQDVGYDFFTDEKGENYCYFNIDENSFIKSGKKSFKCNIVTELPEEIYAKYFSSQNPNQVLINYLSQFIELYLKKRNCYYEGLVIEPTKASKKYGIFKDKLKLTVFEVKPTQANTAAIIGSDCFFLLMGDAFRGSNHLTGRGLNDSIQHVGITLKFINAMRKNKEVDSIEMVKELNNEYEKISETVDSTARHINGAVSKSEFALEGVTSAKSHHDTIKRNMFEQLTLWLAAKKAYSLPISTPEREEVINERKEGRNSNINKSTSASTSQKEELINERKLERSSNINKCTSAPTSQKEELINERKLERSSNINKFTSAPTSQKEELINERKLEMSSNINKFTSALTSQREELIHKSKEEGSSSIKKPTSTSTSQREKLSDEPRKKRAAK